MEKRKMKIAFVGQPWESFVPPIESGSIPIWTYEVVRRLKENCEFIVYSKKKKNLPKEEVREGITCRRMSVKLDMLSHKFTRRIPFVCRQDYPFFASVFYYPLYILKVARDLQSQDCDIIHVMNFSQFVPIIRSFNPHSRIVLNMHCDWLIQLPSAMIQRRLAQTDMVVGCSNYVTREVQKAYPQVADRCQTVLNGSDVRNFSDRCVWKKKQGEVCLLFIGRLSPEKGIHVLLEAFASVLKRYPQVRLNIVGPEGAAPIDFLVNVCKDPKVQNLASFYSGSYMDYLKGQMSPEVASRVRFTGFISHNELIDYFSEADILVNPSFWESFGRSLIEAMACRLPVVGTRVGGMPEIVEEGRTGLLVESGNASALAQAILLLIENEELRLAMGEAGRERAEKYFSWEMVAESMLNRYEEVMKSHA